MIVHLIIYITSDDLTAVLWQSNGLGRGFQEIFIKNYEKDIVVSKIIRIFAAQNVWF